MANFRYWLGPWQRDPQLRCWVAPPGTVGSLDFGSLAECALSPDDHSMRGIGMFCTPVDQSLPSEYDLLAQGDGREIAATDSHRDMVQGALGVRPIGGPMLVDALYDLFMLGDPTGQERWRPLMPERLPDGSLAFTIHLGGHSRVLCDPFTEGHRWWNKLRDVLRSDLQAFDRDTRAAAQSLRDAAKELRRHGKDAGRLDDQAAYLESHAPRVLDGFCRKYGCNPLKISTEIHRGRARTTISDDFNRADGAVGSDWGNATASTNFSIYSNALRNMGSKGTLKHQTPLSSSDCYATETVYASASGDGPIIRAVNSTTRSNYEAWNYGSEYLIKSTSGSQTNLASGSVRTPVAGDLRKLSGSGSTLTAWMNGVSQCSATDSTHTNLYCGFVLDYSLRADAFEASDGLADGPSLAVIVHHLRQQGIC